MNLIEVTSFGSTEPEYLVGYSDEDHARALARAVAEYGFQRARDAYVYGDAPEEQLAAFEAALDNFNGL